MSVSGRQAIGGTEKGIGIVDTRGPVRTGTTHQQQLHLPVWGYIDLGGALIQYHTDVYSKTRVIDSGESENLQTNFME